MNKPIQALKDLRRLKEFTTARIGLERAGSSIATRHMLNFDLDHARARDAVHLPFEAQEIELKLQDRNISSIKVNSAAKDRTTYLQRPDLGRRLDSASRQALKKIAIPSGVDLCIVVADGLSTRAIHNNAIIFLETFLSLTPVRDLNYSPVAIASNARVAIADEIGELLNARLSMILIGERPGLSASDSMGIYLTYAPKKGKTDAERNCISNVRQGGLSHMSAATQLESLVFGALKLGLSGIGLKESSLTHSLE